MVASPRHRRAFWMVAFAFLAVMAFATVLAQHVTPRATILGFAIAVSAGIGASAIRLVGGTTATPQPS